MYLTIRRLSRINASFRVMMMVLAAALVTSLPCSCASGNNKSYSAETTVEDKGVRVKVSIEGVTKSDFSRSGSFITRRYNFVILYPAREKVSITSFTEKEILAPDEMCRNTANIAMRVSPDGKHFALDLGAFIGGVCFFHLLPAGPPMHVKGFDDAMNCRRLGDIDWQKIPAPENIAREYLRKKIGKAEFCMDWSLERPLSLNTNMPHVAETILEGWPLCGDMHSIVEEMAGKTAAAAWKESLKKRIDALLIRQDLPIHAATGIIDACRALGDAGRRDLAYKAALRHWPYPDIHQIYMLYVEELPEGVRKDLVEKARVKLDSSGAQQYEKDYSREVLHKLR